MRLTKFTDLALRVAMRLATASDGEVFTSREVAVAVGAPYTHVAKVVSRLQHLGIVDAKRGRGGGLVLTPQGYASSVGRLMRELEGYGDVVECEGTLPCPLCHGCKLRLALSRAQEAFYAALDPVTVYDMAGEPGPEKPSSRFATRAE